MEDLKFVFKKQTYLVSPKAYTEPNSIIVLPDGRLLYINGWQGNSDPLEPSSFKVLNPLEAKLADITTKG